MTCATLGAMSDGSCISSTHKLSTLPTGLRIGTASLLNPKVLRNDWDCSCNLLQGVAQSLGRCGWVRLHKKGGKQHEMPCNHNLEAYLDAYINAAGLAGDLKGYLFRTVRGRALTTNPLAHADVYRMIRRRAF